jgi:hypothetical protein
MAKGLSDQMMLQWASSPYPKRQAVTLFLAVSYTRGTFLQVDSHVLERL